MAMLWFWSDYILFIDFCALWDWEIFELFL